MNSSRRRNNGPGRPKDVPQESVLKAFVKDLSSRNRDNHRSAFLAFLQSVTGLEVEARLVDNRVYKGVLYTATPFEGKKHEIALKAARKLDQSGRVIQDDNVAIGSTVLISFNDLQYLTVSKDKLAVNEGAKDLETDSMLSRRTNIADLEGRDLQSIDNSWLAPETSTTLDNEIDGKWGLGSWDQFEANKRLYDVQDTFDENLYTKKLDKSQLTKEQQARADRMAYQIERGVTSNPHLAEERGQIVDDTADEEDRYSGVLRQQQGQQVSRTNAPATGRSPSASAGKGRGRGDFGKSSPGGSWRQVSMEGASPKSGSTTPTASSGGAWGRAGRKETAVVPPQQQAKRESDPLLPPGLEHSADGTPPISVKEEPKVSSETAVPEKVNETVEPLEKSTTAASIEEQKVEDKKEEKPVPKPASTLRATAVEFVPSTAASSSTPKQTPGVKSPTQSSGNVASHGHSGHSGYHGGNKGNRGGRRYNNHNHGYMQHRGNMGGAGFQGPHFDPTYVQMGGGYGMQAPYGGQPYMPPQYMAQYEHYMQPPNYFAKQQAPYYAPQPAFPMFPTGMPGGGYDSGVGEVMDPTGGGFCSPMDGGGEVPVAAGLGEVTAAPAEENGEGNGKASNDGTGPSS